MAAAVSSMRSSPSIRRFIPSVFSAPSHRPPASGRASTSESWVRDKAAAAAARSPRRFVPSSAAALSTRPAPSQPGRASISESWVRDKAKAGAVAPSSASASIWLSASKKPGRVGDKDPSSPKQHAPKIDDPVSQVPPSLNKAPDRATVPASSWRDKASPSTPSESIPPARSCSSDSWIRDKEAARAMRTTPDTFTGGVNVKRCLTLSTTDSDSVCCSKKTTGDTFTGDVNVKPCLPLSTADPDCRKKTTPETSVSFKRSLTSSTSSVSKKA